MAGVWRGVVKADHVSGQPTVLRADFTQVGSGFSVAVRGVLITNE